MTFMVSQITNNSSTFSHVIQGEHKKPTILLPAFTGRFLSQRVNKYSLLMHRIKIKSPAIFLWNE